MLDAAAGDADDTIRRVKNSITHCFSLDRFTFMIVQVRILIEFPRIIRLPGG
jgi:hypothetical protein